MNLVRSATPALTGFDLARAWLFDGVHSVSPVDVPIQDALGAVCARMERSSGDWPAADIAAIDGFAFATADIVGASAYSPAILTERPEWIEVGEELPSQCDCVLEAPCVDVDGALVQVMCEAFPGQGVRRAASDIAGGSAFLKPGHRLTAIDLLAARRNRLNHISVHRPQLRIIDVGANDGHRHTTALVNDLATNCGARPAPTLKSARDAAAIAEALTISSADLIVTIGGTGDGQTDAIAETIAACGSLFAHGIAIQPGQRTAVGRIGTTPIVALPGLPDQALGAWLMLVEPLVGLLSGLVARRSLNGRLTRKISSAIGFCDLVLLASEGEELVPMATGGFSLRQAITADAWLAVPADSEGYPAGTTVNAWPLRETP